LTTTTVSRPNHGQATPDPSFERKFSGVPRLALISLRAKRAPWRLRVNSSVRPQFGERAGIGSWERKQDALAMYARFGAIAPEHRVAKLAVRAMEFGEHLARAVGAGFIYSLATLKIPNMQLALERAGYPLLGFAPGYDRELVAPGVVKRVYAAFYAKVLVPEEDLLRPDPRNRSPKAKALFEVLFPN
jgi:hypothetical protein